MKLYLDTNIWIDYLDEKRENHGKALRLFDKIQKEGHIIIVSELHIYETKVNGYYDPFEKTKNELWKKSLCKGIKVEADDKEEAKELDAVFNRGKADFLHMLTAKRQNCVAISSDQDWEDIAKVLGMSNFTYESFFRYF